MYVCVEASWTMCWGGAVGKGSLYLGPLCLQLTTRLVLENKLGSWLSTDF